MGFLSGFSKVGFVENYGLRLCIAKYPGIANSNDNTQLTFTLSREEGEEGKMKNTGFKSCTEKKIIRFLKKQW